MTLFCELSIRFIYKISISVELITLVLTHCALGKYSVAETHRVETIWRWIAYSILFKSELRRAEGHIGTIRRRWPKNLYLDTLFLFSILTSTEIAPIFSFFAY